MERNVYNATKVGKDYFISRPAYRGNIRPEELEKVIKPLEKGTRELEKLLKSLEIETGETMHGLSYGLELAEEYMYLWQLVRRLKKIKTDREEGK